jgi:hypothetical protein
MDINFIKDIIKNNTKEVLQNGRNLIVKYELDSSNIINIKSFRTPNLINRIVYRYFRKSKARRSFEFANILLDKGVGTPKPIAYFENFNWLGLKDSYYVSEHLNNDLTFRELVENSNFPDHENILRQFIRFSYDLHQKGIEFKDHSPGNTLIKRDLNGNYSFYLVDLNRMEFHAKMSFESRMENLCRLTPKIEMIEVMANEYALCSGQKYEDVFSLLWKYTSEFQHKYHRKRALKKKYMPK